MEKNSFIKLAGIYGADLERWPEELRHNAANFANNYPELLKNAIAIDNALDSFETSAANPELLERIVAQVEREDSNQPIVLVFRLNSWARGIAFASIAALGLFIGSINSLDQNFIGSQDFADISTDSDQDIFNSTNSITNEVMP